MTLLKPLFHDLFGMLVCSGVLYGLYAALLDRRIPFRWCRIYLLASVVAATVIPLLRIPVWPGPTIHVVPDIVVGGFDETAVETLAEEPATAWPLLFGGIYALGTLLIALPAVRQLLQLRRFRKGARIVRTAEYTLVRTPQPVAACSFFRQIYVPADTPDEELPAILLHERSHVRHRHSAERLFMETIKALEWWNPFVWLLAGRLREVQEFEADSDVLRSGCDPQQYMQLILKQLFGYRPDITNGLRNSLTKKRFLMMTTHSSQRYVLLRVAGALPAVLALLCAFSFTVRAAEYLYPDPATEPTVAEVSAAPQPTEASAAPEEPVLRAEVMPAFQGSGNLNDFRTWVQMRVRMPEEALEKQLQGRVVATFTIEKDGTLDDIRILQSPDPLFSDEVIRVLKGSDKWTPGTQEGKAVRVKYTLPIDFRIAGAEEPAEQEPAPAASETTAAQLIITAYPPRTPAKTPVTVRATVLQNGEPLTGVLVHELGSLDELRSLKGTVTDGEGRAEIETSEGRTLKFIYPGTSTAYYTVGPNPQQEIRISLVTSAPTEGSATHKQQITISSVDTSAADGKPTLIVDDQSVEGSLNELLEALDPKNIASISIYKENGENTIVIRTKTDEAAASASSDAQPSNR